MVSPPPRKPLLSETLHWLSSRKPELKMPPAVATVLPAVAIVHHAVIAVGSGDRTAHHVYLAMPTYLTYLTRRIS